MSVYRPTYTDPKTGERKPQQVWWYNFIFAGHYRPNDCVETFCTVRVAAVHWCRKVMAPDRKPGAIEFSILATYDPRRRADVISVSDNQTERNSDFQIIQRIKAVLSDADLNCTERCFAAFLMLSAGEAGEASWKHETLAERLHVCARHSKRARRRLQDRACCSIQRGMKRNPTFTGCHGTPNR